MRSKLKHFTSALSASNSRVVDLVKEPDTLGSFPGLNNWIVLQRGFWQHILEPSPSDLCNARSIAETAPYSFPFLNAVKHLVAEVAKTFGRLLGMAESLRDFRYK